MGVGKTLHKSALPRPHHHLSSPKIDRSTEGSKPLMVSNNMHTVKMTQLNSASCYKAAVNCLLQICERAEEEDTEYVDVCVRIRCESSPTSTVCACLAHDNAVVLPALPSGPKGSKPTFFLYYESISSSPADAPLLNYDRRGKKPSKDGRIEGMAEQLMRWIALVMLYNIMQHSSQL